MDILFKCRILAFYGFIRHRNADMGWMDSMAKVLVLGSKGMAGHVFLSYFKEAGKHEVVGLKRPEFDILSNGWNAVLDSHFVGLKEGQEVFIINCIGLLKAQSNSYPISAIKVNSLFPHELAAYAGEKGARLIHISTDCWKDEDYYGRSKRAGEILSGQTTIRTSIVGPELRANGSGLFHWFMSQKGTVDGYCNHLWDGVTTLQLAKVIHNRLGSLSEGVVELRSENAISKYDLLLMFKEIFHNDVEVRKKHTEKVDKTAKSDISISLSISEQVSELKKWMGDHHQLYEQY